MLRHWSSSFKLFYFFRGDDKKEKFFLCFFPRNENFFFPFRHHLGFDCFKLHIFSTNLQLRCIVMVVKQNIKLQWSHQVAWTPPATTLPMQPSTLGNRSIAFYHSHNSKLNDKRLVILYKTRRHIFLDKRSAAISHSAELSPFVWKLIQIYYVLIHFSFNASTTFIISESGKKTIFTLLGRYCYRWLVIYLAYFPLRSHNAWHGNILRISIERNQFNLVHVHLAEFGMEEGAVNWMREIV